MAKKKTKKKITWQKQVVASPLLKKKYKKGGFGAFLKKSKKSKK